MYVSEKLDFSPVCMLQANVNLATESPVGVVDLM